MTIIKDEIAGQNALEIWELPKCQCGSQEPEDYCTYQQGCYGYDQQVIWNQEQKTPEPKFWENQPWLPDCRHCGGAGGHCNCSDYLGE